MRPGQRRSTPSASRSEEKFRARQTGPPLRRGSRRDGFRRTRQADTFERKIELLPTILSHPHPEVGFPPRTSF